METLAQIYARHSGPGKFNDKNSIHSYIPIYEELLAPYRMNIDAELMEIGLYDGHSFLMWREYMQGGVFGIDISDHPLDKVDLTPILKAHPLGVRILDGSDESDVEKHFPVSCYRWDVVIDDAAHTLGQQVKIYEIWSRRMKPGGIYIIEDLQNEEAISVFKGMGARIIDRRHVKKRYDDVLAVFSC